MGYMEPTSIKVYIFLNVILDINEWSDNEWSIDPTIIIIIKISLRWL